MTYDVQRPTVSLREQSIPDGAVPRMELAEWAARFGVVAGITTRGRGFSLGLWSEENVGQVMSRWRAVGAAFRPRFPGRWRGTVRPRTAG